MMISPASPTVEEPRQRWFQFSLRTLVLLTTLVAVTLGLIQTGLLLGAAFIVACPAALVRTFRAAAIAETDGRPMNTVALIGTFANSLTLVVSIAVAWLGTLAIACFAAGLFAAIVLASLCRFVAVYLAGASWRALAQDAEARASARRPWQATASSISPARMGTFT
jgi:glucose-6-phosphate-specific signal transduction histidine kinase